MRLFARHTSPKGTTGHLAWACFALLPLCAAAQTAASANVDLNDPVNQQVLRSWQQQTGQAIPFGSLQISATIDAATGKPTTGATAPWEFHGQIELGGYNQRVANPSGNAALGSARSGDFGKIVFQGDVRSTNAELDTTYAQGTLTSTDDPGLQPRYATQINNLQVGRSGPGYQIALGDVAASFSGLSSNQGLRGALLSKDLGALTATGYAGVVADSWEALSNRDTRGGQPARTRNLRDVMGIKGEYKLSPQANTPADGQASVYATVQNYRDRAGSANPLASLNPLPLGTVIAPLTTLEATIASLGGKYSRGDFQFTSELATSQTEDQNASQDSATDNAFVIDALYKIGPVSLRAGYHDIGANYTALAQTNVPGVRETYAGADWQITPQLLWGVDARTAITRAATLAAISGGTGTLPASESSLDSLSNRVSYSLQDMPGLAFSLLDTRSQGRDALRNDNRIDNTQLGASFADTTWNANILLGIGHARSDANPLRNSNSTQWQLFLGRNWNNVNSTAPVGWTVGLQGTLGQQVQKFIRSATGSKATNLGLNLQAAYPQLGSFSAGWQMQTIQQSVPGATRLTSHTLNLDWSRDFGLHWSAKAYAKASRRNHSDALLQYDETTLGIQGTYKW